MSLIPENLDNITSKQLIDHFVGMGNVIKDINEQLENISNTKHNCTEKDTIVKYTTKVDGILDKDIPAINKNIDSLNTKIEPLGTMSKSVERLERKIDNGIIKEIKEYVDKVVPKSSPRYKLNLILLWTALATTIGTFSIAFYKSLIAISKLTQAVEALPK